MEVKGTFLVDFVKVIRANKGRNFDQWLNAEDRKLVKSRILPSQWYPFHLYHNAGQAIFMEVAGQSLETTRDFGRLIGKHLIEAYENLAIRGDPTASLQKFFILRKVWFKDVKSTVVMTKSGPGHLEAKLVLSADDKITEDEAFAYLLAGNLDSLLEQTGVKNPSTEVKKVQGGYVYSFKWEKA